MNLPSSIFVTALIVAVVWLAAVFQPGQAVAYDADSWGELDEASKPVAVAGAAARQQIEQKMPVASIAKAELAAAEKVVAEKATARLVAIDQLVGITREISLNDIDSLWLEFTDNAGLHERVMFDQGSIYVLYRELSSSFDRARVTIGYNSDEVKGRNTQTLVPQGDYEVLLNMGKHSASSLRNAWGDIDYGKSVEALVERHVINDAGQVVSTGLFVLYR